MVVRQVASTARFHTSEISGIELPAWQRPGPRVVLFGIMAREPYAGVAIQGLHYIEGLARLGYDVYYVEDTGMWPYDAEQETVTDDPSYALRYIGGLMDRIGKGDRWAYRSGVDGAIYNMSAGEYRRLIAGTDVLINLTGATLLKDDYARVPVRIYLETDPVTPQIEVAAGRKFTIDLLDTHTHFFTYGENLGAPDCTVPVSHYDYRPTRQPVILDWWVAGGDTDLAPAPIASRFTTIANWEQTREIEWNGERYAWSKHLEFLKFIDLPRRTSQPLEVALAGADGASLETLVEHGWWIGNALMLSRDVLAYRDYIIGSRGEFTVAKDQNIRLRSGWFSDRSATYLAAGRPVVTQDTGFGNVLPTGDGLFAFRTMEDAAAALDEIAGRYLHHCQSAREIAEEYFRAETVLSTLMEEAGVCATMRVASS